MKNSIIARVLRSLAFALASLLIPLVSYAVPYASDVTNNAGVVSFRLNENADNVKIVSSGGTVTNDLGAGVKGLTVTNLGIAGGAIKVLVLRSAPTGYTQISDDGFQDNGVYVNKFEQPRGVVVNKNPALPSFGRIYVANGRGQADTGAPYVRTTFQGIYMINSDNTVALDTGTTPRRADLAFTDGQTGSPMRLNIGKDDNQLYICDVSDPSGGLWVTDLDVTTGTNVLQGIGDLTYGSTTHGSIYGVVAEGSLGSSNLKIFTIDEDLTPVRSVWRYDVGSGPLPYAAVATGPLSTAPIANFTGDLAKGGANNYLYFSQNRSSGTEVNGPGVRIFTEDGTVVTNSQDASRAFLGNPTAADLLRNTVALDLSPDGNTLAVLQGASFGRVLLVPLTNGIFNFAGTNSFLVGSASDNNRDVAFDAAGNLYVINTAVEWLRIFSKGGATLATTGTDGTFTVGTPPLLVSASNSVATANEQGPVNGQFTISRVGDTSGALTVNYTISGTATGGTDYTALSGSVTLSAGVASTNISVALLADTLAEFTETVVLTITPSANYGISTATATVSIIDNEPTEVSVALAQTESRLLEGYSGSKVGFRVERRGLINSAITANLVYSGTATGRFIGPATAAIGTNVASVTINITPINNQTYDGNQTAVGAATTGAGYIVGTNTAVANVIDDEVSPGTILFSDNFNVASSNTSPNWIINSQDSFADTAADFGFDYTTLGIPAYPSGTDTLGLRLRCNQVTAGAAAIDISLSPLGLDLGTNDYRLIFNMWINYNGVSPNGPLSDGGAGSTYHLDAGVGTTGDHPNWQNFFTADGVWFSIDGDGGSGATSAAGDCNAYVGTTLFANDSGVYSAGTNSGVRSTPHPFYSLWGGIPGPAAQVAISPTQSGLTQVGNLGMSWHTVVITKVTNNVRWTIDGVAIATVTNDPLTLSTNVFVGYHDQFAGISGTPAMSFAVIDNLKVTTYTDLAPVPPTTPNITSIQVVGANVQINFTGSAADAASAFTLLSAGTVNGTYLDAGATMSGSSGSFQATVPVNGATRFYRIKR
jgi:hypothetical protein